jgi:hypothetical protein
MPAADASWSSVKGLAEALGVSMAELSRLVEAE